MQKRLARAHGGKRKSEAGHFAIMECSHNLAAGVVRDNEERRRNCDRFAPNCVLQANAFLILRQFRAVADIEVEGRQGLNHPKREYRSA
jgi:hypothetical protein